MRKQLAVAEIFEYRPDAIRLVGFPPSDFFYRLCSTLGKEEHLRQYRTSFSGVNAVLPSFPAEHAQRRQSFFQRLNDCPTIGKRLFRNAFPSKESRKYSADTFIYFCGRVHETVQLAREELTPLKHMPEARSILRIADSFDKEFGERCKRLEDIDKLHRFYIDTRTGLMKGILDEEAAPDEEQKSREEKYPLLEVKARMKKSALAIIERGKENFREEIFRFARQEFSFSQSEGNFRRCFEQLAVPIRLHAEYGRFLRAWGNQEEDRFEDNIRDIGDDEDETDGELQLPINLIPSARYAQFRDHYDIQNMFPLSLSTTPRAPRRFVPINFATRRGERKFFLAGLHSGGKSLFLENIVLGSIASLIGERCPADSLVVPSYEGIFYYKNTDNGRGGAGKAETEIREVSEIISDSEEGDLLVFDEFLGAADEYVGNWMGSELFGRLMRSKATVFVSSHRAYNFRGLEKEGWTILTPEHQVIGGKVVPSKKLKRGLPDHKINGRYIREKYRRDLS